MISVHDSERTKADVVAVYQLMSDECKPDQAIEHYVGEDYIQHNPHVAKGKGAFIAYLERTAREWPGKRVEIKRAIAEGEYVVVPCFRRWPGDHDYAGIDIFRLDDEGSIIEHWDVLQAAPQHAANPNGLY